MEAFIQRFPLCQQCYLWLTAFLFAAAMVVAWNVTALAWPWCITLPVSWALGALAGYCLSQAVDRKDVLAKQGGSVLRCLHRRGTTSGAHSD